MIHPTSRSKGYMELCMKMIMNIMFPKKHFMILNPGVFFFYPCLKPVSLGYFRYEIICQKEEKHESQHEVTHQLPVPAVGLHHVRKSVDGPSQQPLGALIVPTLENVQTGFTIAPIYYA